MAIKLEVPHNGWEPRPHQENLWRALREEKIRRAVAVWHRRAGKDEVCLHHTMVSAVERVGNYWHMLPEFSQGRKAVWSAVNPHTGRRRIDEAFPQAFRANTNDNEMFIRFKNGSTWSVVGSDAVTTGGGIGSSTAGIVFSEWALANPSAWGYYRPILEENQGWAAFISTPRGRNHLHSMFEFAKRDPAWFAELLTIDDTQALTPEAAASSLREYISLYGEDMGRAQFRQEYYCDFNAAILGAFFAHEMRQVRDEERILEIDAVPDQLVHRSWDLGVRDDTSIWWFQLQGAQLAILDHYSASGVGLEHFAEVIEQREREHGWLRGHDYVPHDAKVKELGTGKTRVETMEKLGLHPLLVPLATIQDGINAVRRTLPLCIFHPRCEEVGINALEQYRREWDDEKKAFRVSPLHDWTSNPADSFRYLAQAWRYAPLKPLVQEAPRTAVGFVIPPPPEDRRGIQL